MSNILNVFYPPESRDLKPEEVEDCLPCQLMASIGCTATGAWFLSGKAFEDNTISVEENLKKNPVWWRNCIKGVGIGLIGYGAFRGYEMVRDQSKKFTE